eukprot:PhF_6_TR24459/c0_g1_i1/m.33819
MAQVTLVVYDLISDDAKAKEGAREIISFLGMGVYHSGIEVYGEEWSFGGDFSGSNDPTLDGVFSVEPRTCLPTFREAINLGTTSLSPNDVRTVLGELSQKWKAITYHILSRNCNCFSLEFATRLGVAAAFPPWINRAANVGDKVVPDVLLQKILKLANPPGPAPAGMKATITYDGPIPKVAPTCILTPTQIREREQGSKPAPQPAPASGGGLMGMGMGLLSKGADLVKQGVSVVDQTVRSKIEEDQEKSFRTKFPTAQEKFVAAYTCQVVYAHLPVKASVFITDRTLYVSGERQLGIAIPYTEIISLRYATAVEGELKHLPPHIDLVKLDRNFTPLATSDPNAIMIYTRAKEVLTLFFFSGLGVTLDNTVAVLVGTSSQKMTATVRAFAFLDFHWRTCTPVPVPGVPYVDV